MSEMVPMYGFGGGGAGDTLTVITPGAGITVTVSKDGKSKTKISGADGVAVFKGMESGTWTVTMTDGSQTATKTATVTTDYAVSMTFFAATINVTYPAGSTCTATDGVTTLTAPDTSGAWEFVVSNAGTWTIRAVNGVFNDSKPVNVTESGATYSIRLTSLPLNEELWIKAYPYATTGPIGTYVFEDGTIHSTITGQQDCTVVTKNKISVTDKKTVSVLCSLDNDLGDNARVAVKLATTRTNGQASGNHVVASKIITTAAESGELVIDVTNITGEYYIWLVFTSWNSISTTNVVFYSCDLE